MQTPQGQAPPVLMASRRPLSVNKGSRSMPRGGRLRIKERSHRGPAPVLSHLVTRMKAAELVQPVAPSATRAIAVLQSCDFPFKNTTKKDHHPLRVLCCVRHG
ncbi:unnamed protein product [Arctogadus glacialis]